MSATEKVTFYNFNPDNLAMYLAQNDWKGAWTYIRSLIESFSMRMDQSHNISIQKSFESHEKRKYAEEFGGLMGQLLVALLTNPSCRIDDKNFRHLIYIHEVIHTFLALAGLGDTDTFVNDILSKEKKLSPGAQKKVLLLLSLQSNLDVGAVYKKCSLEYRAQALCAYTGYLKIYDRKIYDRKIEFSQFGRDIETLKHPDQKSLVSTLSPYFSCSYLNIEDKHAIKKHVNQSILRYFAKQKKEIEVVRRKGVMSLPVTIDKNKPTMIVLWEYFYSGHAMLRVWGPWIKEMEKQFNVVNIAHKQFENIAPKEYFQNIICFESIGDMYLIADYIDADMAIYTSVGMSFWGIALSNLRLAPMQIQLLGHPATTYSKDMDFVYGPTAVLKEEAFPTDILIADDLPLTYESRMTRAEVENIDLKHYQKGSGKPLRVSVIGSEIKVCAPFIDLLKEIEDESDFDIEFSFHLGTAGMDTLFAEKFFFDKFKNVHYHGWQPYEDYLKSMCETDIVLNPFPFGHTNTLIDTLILGKPCIGLQGIEPASLTEKMMLEEVGLVDMFSVETMDDYKKKFRELSARILDGDTVFYDRMNMFDILHAPAQTPDYSQSMMWLFNNADAMKSSGRKLFKVGESLGDA